MISDFNFYIKYHFEKTNAKTDIFIKMSNCILNNENKKIQEYYQVLLLSEQFQIAALKRRKSTQQSTLNKHNFYEQIKKTN